MGSRASRSDDSMVAILLVVLAKFRIAIISDVIVVDISDAMKAAIFLFFAVQRAFGDLMQGGGLLASAAIKRLQTIDALDEAGAGFFTGVPVGDGGLSQQSELAVDALHHMTERGQGIARD